MSTAPEAPAAGGAAGGAAGRAAGGALGGAAALGSNASQKFRGCWSCRVLSGGGLLLSGAYVYIAARRVLRQGGPTSMGTVAQITFAACVAAWGVVILLDPVGKQPKKT